MNSDYKKQFIQTIDNIPRHPAQLYEAFCYLMIFIFLMNFYKKRKASLPAGFIFGLFMTILFTCRFFIEFIKIDQVAFEEGMVLNMGQLLSLPMIVGGILVMIRKSTNKH